MGCPEPWQYGVWGCMHAHARVAAIDTRGLNVKHTMLSGPLGWVGLVSPIGVPTIRCIVVVTKAVVFDDHASTDDSCAWLQQARCEPVTVITSNRGPILLVVFPIRIGLLAEQIPVVVGSWRCSERR